jgi:hypothetical protein
VALVQKSAFRSNGELPSDVMGITSARHASAYYAWGVTSISGGSAMTRIAVLSFIIGLLSAPLAAHAQQSSAGRIVAHGGYGSADLPQQQADCYLDLAKSRTKAVTGIDLIVITEETRQLWYSYLADRFPKLVFAEQQPVFLSCLKLTVDNVNWSKASPTEREQYRQEWGASLPAMLQFIEPALRTAQQRAAIGAQEDAAFRAAQQSIGPAPDAIAAAERERQMRDSLNRHNATMTDLVVGQIRAMSRK